jgi:hypothetical protein
MTCMTVNGDISGTAVIEVELAERAESVSGKGVARAAVPSSRAPRGQPTHGLLRLWPAAVVAVLFAVAGSSQGGESGGTDVPLPSGVDEQTVAPVGEAPLVEAEGPGVQNTEPSIAGVGHAPPRSTPTTSPNSWPPPQASSTGGTVTEDQDAVDAPTAGSPMFYTDPAGDADGPAAQAALSQPAFDILRVDWAPASQVDGQRRGYSTSMTVAGVARDDGSYVSYGLFYDDRSREQCELYHFLTPGTTAFGNAFCGSNLDGTRRLVGRVQGSRVSATRTKDGGTLLTATFDDSALPALVERGGRMLWYVSAMTCVRGSGPLHCNDTLDDAYSRRSYRL